MNTKHVKKESPYITRPYTEYEKVIFVQNNLPLKIAVANELDTLHPCSTM